MSGSGAQAPVWIYATAAAAQAGTAILAFSWNFLGILILCVITPRPSGGVLFLWIP